MKNTNLGTLGIFQEQNDKDKLILFKDMVKSEWNRLNLFTGWGRSIFPSNKSAKTADADATC